MDLVTQYLAALTVEYSREHNCSLADAAKAVVADKQLLEYRADDVMELFENNAMLEATYAA